MENPRKPVLAGILSILFGGLGHLYAGRPLRAFVILAISSAYGVVIISVGAPSFWVMLLWLVLAIGYAVWVFRDAYRCARQEQADRLAWYQRGYVYVGFAILVVLIGVARDSLPRRHRAFVIPSGAMMPTLRIGDRLMIDQSAYRKSAPARGDVVVFQYPKDPKIFYIMRIVGVPGDILAIDGKDLIVNGGRLPRTSKRVAEIPELEVDLHSQFTGKRLELEEEGARIVLFDSSANHVSMPEKKLADGEYFVMGDNRDFSNDSRFWGAVPAENIVGKAEYVWLSFAENIGVRWRRFGERIR